MRFVLIAVSLALFSLGCKTNPQTGETHVTKDECKNVVKMAEEAKAACLLLKDLDDISICVDAANAAAANAKLLCGVLGDDE